MNIAEEKIRLIPLKQLVCQITHEASIDDEQGIKRAVKGWHNKLANGSVPRSLFKKIGRELFMDLNRFSLWLEQQEEVER